MQRKAASAQDSQSDGMIAGRRIGRADGTGSMTWLLVLAFVLRALLAPGIMPAFAGDAGPLITICTPQGERTLPADGGDGSRTAHADAPCLFAAAGFTNLGAVTAAILSAPVEWLSVRPVFAFCAHHACFGPDRAHARGPPIMVQPLTYPGPAT